MCVRVRLFGAPQSENVTTNLKVTPLAGYGMFPVNRSGSLLGSGRLLRHVAVSALPPAASYFVRLPRLIINVCLPRLVAAATQLGSERCQLP